MIHKTRKISEQIEPAISKHRIINHHHDVFEKFVYRYAQLGEFNQGIAVLLVVEMRLDFRRKLIDGIEESRFCGFFPLSSDTRGAICGWRLFENITDALICDC